MMSMKNLNIYYGFYPHMSYGSAPWVMFVKQKEL